jgi:hypothetical protein
MYFPNNFYEKFLWVHDPFQAYNHENDLSLSKREHLIDLSSDSCLKIQFGDLGFSRFWISHSLRSEFPELSEEALKTVMQFSTTYLCEKEFSSLLQFKTKYINHLSVCASFQMNLTNIEPDIQELFKSQQAQPSH